MITLFFFVVFIAGYFYQHSRRPIARDIQWYNRYRMPLILLSVLIIPILFLNLNPSDGRPLSDEEYIEYIEEYGADWEKIEAYEKYMKVHPNNIHLRFKFIQVASSDFSFEKDSLRKYHYSSNKFIQRQSLAYAEAYAFTDDTIKPNPQPDQKYTNFIYATEKMRTGDLFLAELYLLQEIEINPNYDPSYKALLMISEIRSPKKYHEYIRDKRFIETLSFAEQRYIYFKTDQWYNYFEVITTKAFFEVEFMAFIAALVISILWMLFLRSLDVFNKEKWRDIIMVFLIASLMTHLCLLGYDYFHHTLNFGINGQGFNDFLYCTVVIGLSEETVKLIPWLLFLLITRKAKEPYDYLLYASVSALGFAFVENFTYLENPGNITVRSIMSTVGHMFDASIVAYGFVLGRYKAKGRIMKVLYPLGGFIAGCIAHGFYDFWLISPSFSGMHIITVVFFVITVHIWFNFLNNAINNSPFYVARSFNPLMQLDLLSVGIVSVMILEYVLVNYRYGTDQANARVVRMGWSVPVFLSYVTVLFSEFKLVKGRWKKFRFNWGRAIGFFGNFGRLSDHRTSDRYGYESYEGLELRLFVQKSNRYVADKFPISGRCLGFVTVSDIDNWTLFEITSEFNYPGYRNDKVIIRTKSAGESLHSDKVEIILLFIPDHISLPDDELRTEQLRFTGRAFSRPI